MSSWSDGPFKSTGATNHGRQSHPSGHPIIEFVMDPSSSTKTTEVAADQKQEPLDHALNRHILFKVEQIFAAYRVEVNTAHERFICRVDELQELFTRGIDQTTDGTEVGNIGQTDKKAGRQELESPVATSSKLDNLPQGPQANASIKEQAASSHREDKTQDWKGLILVCLEYQNSWLGE